MTVSVLKIRFLPLEKAKNGKSEQVRGPGALKVDHLLFESDK
jgi:hypothetical protein